MKLSESLKAYKQTSYSKKTEDEKTIMQTATANLIKRHLEDRALKKGDHIPPFELPDSTGKIVSMRKLLCDGPVIISFYRGAWCPYCNLELAAYQELLPEIKKRGGQLIAISPEKPDLSLDLKQQKALEFLVLTDKNNHIAKLFGIVFKLEAPLLALYKKMGIDLEASQGNSLNELPLPATYVVAPSGEIILSYINSDYTERLEPMDAVLALEKI